VITGRKITVTHGVLTIGLAVGIPVLVIALYVGCYCCCSYFKEFRSAESHRRMQNPFKRVVRERPQKTNLIHHSRQRSKNALQKGYSNLRSRGGKLGPKFAAILNVTPLSSTNASCFGKRNCWHYTVPLKTVTLGSARPLILGRRSPSTSGPFFVGMSEHRKQRLDKYIGLLTRGLEEINSDHALYILLIGSLMSS